MRKVSLLIVGLLCLSVAAHAGEVITNNTGEDATGLLVTFSEPVLITAFGDILASVDPQMMAYEFTFSGGTVELWNSQWMNWAPATAQIIDYQWLTPSFGTTSAGTSLSDDVYVLASYVEEVTFSIDLLSNLGVPMEAVITRRMSVETIPFWVEYTVDDPEDATEYQWVLYTPDYPAQYESGLSVRLLPKSNAKDLTLSIRIVVDDISYRWEETIDFPLHNLTEISLDATAFYPDEEISVEWSAANGDPADAVTFPIRDIAEATTTLVSEWPNVLTVSCAITQEDGFTSTSEVEALVYFRDGTPFEIRSVSSTVSHPMPLNDLYAVWDQEFSLLRSLGVNAITTFVHWYFGPPDGDGNWTIHPIWQSGTAWPFDARGNTILTADLERFVIRAHQEGFRVLVEMRARPYWTNQSIEWDYTTWDPITRTSHSFRATDEWWFGDGEGFANFLLSYLDEFVRLDIDEVFMGVEDGAVEQSGGEKTRNFYESIIAEYRGEGFRGGISYAIGFDERYGYYDQLFDPSASGIPLGSMDAIAATYYPVLSEKTDASTLEMQNNVQSHIDEHFQRLSGVYGIPTIIEDCYCQAYAGCAVNPLQTSGEVDEECSRRYFTAILREFARANTDSEAPWIKGLTIAGYKIMLDRYVGDFFEGGGLPSPWLNESGGKIALQLAIKTFFSDNPLLSNDQNGIEPRASEVEVIN